MEYNTHEWSVSDLLALHSKDELNLAPSYQRNDIWTLPTKKRLIDSMKGGYPLPAFFLHKKKTGTYDMVDGQQRTRTLIGYVDKKFPDLNSEVFDDKNPSSILDYKITVVVIDENEDDKVEDFYYRVNHFGSKLNRQEKLKANKSNSLFLKLVQDLSESSEFSSLNIFTEAATDRMLDIEFVSELVAQLKYDITAKKDKADKLYDVIETELEASVLGNEFYEIIRIVSKLDAIYSINKTRYKQKNDFYTLFGFLREVKDMPEEALATLYKLLVVIGPDISPSNEECFSMQDYAFNCVSQSNSVEARKARLKFFQELLLNSSKELNETQVDVAEFYDLSDGAIEVEDYITLDPDKLNSLKKKPIVF